MLLLGLMGLVMAGCSPKPTPTPTPTKTPTTPPLVTPTVTPLPPTPTLLPPTLTPMPTATSEPTLTPTPTVEPTPKLVVMAENINPLTGLQTDPAKLNRRPLVVKIANFPEVARPQAGIGAADMMFEYEAEAYVTRFSAIFLGEDTDLIGPVRSLRLPDAEVVPIFKAALVGSGGHPEVKRRMVEGRAWAEGYKRIICPEEPFQDGGAMRRIANKKSLVELTMYTDTAAMWKSLSQRGVNERQNFYDMFVFSEQSPLGGSAAAYVKIVYKPNYAQVEYKYDAETKTYNRFDMGQPLVDENTGQQIAPSNVVILYVNHVDTDIPADTHDANQTWYAVSIQLWGQGTAQVLRDGQVFQATWVRENPQQPNDRLVFFDAKGQQIPFHPGKTWFQLVRLNAQVTIQ